MANASCPCSATRAALSSLAAASFANPDVVRGKRVVDLGCGLGLGGMAMYDIEVVRDESGAPSLLLHGEAAVSAARRLSSHP